MNLSNYPFIMLYCLLLTIAIEVSVAFILKYRKLDLVNVLLVNVLTNPLLNGILLFIDIRCGHNIRNIILYIMEVLVVLIEGFVYSKCLDKKNINPYLLSFILNFISYFLGLFIV